MKVIIYNTDEGKAAVVYPAPSMFDENSFDRKRLADAGVVLKSEEEAMDYVISRAVPTDKKYVVMEHTDLPEDLYFRDAWTLDKSRKIGYNMDKAAEIHMDVIREWRDVELRKLDIPSMRAMETGDSQSLYELGVKKQELRDIPQTLDLTKAKTVDELKKILPEGM